MSLQDWMNSRAEVAMRKGTEKIMKEAQRKEEELKNSKKFVAGEYRIIFRANDKVEEGEISEILDQIEKLSQECDKNAPNVSITIKPVVSKSDL